MTSVYRLGYRSGFLPGLVELGRVMSPHDHMDIICRYLLCVVYVFIFEGNDHSPARLEACL
ncbi:hypothetical protein Y958_27455 [Nitrospirillum viridazoti CBAmc]|uniref:Uncharacterized protein n=1 Tax=Nitrospirillum viridazoti CBAmc TaxID=1441467 RepID=A0A248K1F8_9PROT|nr:hypothetical protein Y958_27455 [Nitrospirillum amazonense CBAmc]